MINILNKNATNKTKTRNFIDFDGSYIHKFDLALRNLEMVVREDNGYSIRKNRRR